MPGATRSAEWRSILRAMNRTVEIMLGIFSACPSVTWGRCMFILDGNTNPLPASELFSLRTHFNLLQEPSDFAKYCGSVLKGKVKKVGEGEGERRVKTFMR